MESPRVGGGAGTGIRPGVDATALGLGLHRRVDLVTEWTFEQSRPFNMSRRMAPAPDV